jgi:NADH:ubiquinone reductase (H+-translocating)
LKDNGLSSRHENLVKKETPGDRDEIIKSIKKVQQEFINAEPVFPFDTILSRTLDTVEDIIIHVRRVPYNYGWVGTDTTKQRKRQTIVILGSGWAAHAFLKVADTFSQRIIVVSPCNHFVFTPMLASAAVGTVEYRSMTEAVRAANPMIDNYIEGLATNVNVTEKSITVQLKEHKSNKDGNQLDVFQSAFNDIGDDNKLKLQYDKLIVAVGCKVADNMVPGAKEYAFRLKSCDDARRLREAIGIAFEYASRPDVRPIEAGGQRSDVASTVHVHDESHARQLERRRRVTFCIVGGGPTGVELAGEIADFVKDICKPRVGAYPMLMDDVKIILIHGGPDLVPQFDQSLSKSALHLLQGKSSVDVRLNTNVIEVGNGFIRTLSKQSGIEEIIPCGVCIWAAGTEMVPFVETLLEQLPTKARGIGGKVAVDMWLRCPTHDQALLGSVLVVGDAASFQDHGSTGNNIGQDVYLPQTAQVAAQQGAYLARLIDRGYDLCATPPSLLGVNIDSPMNYPSQLLKLWLQLRGLEQSDVCKYNMMTSLWSVLARAIANTFFGTYIAVRFLNLGLLAYVGNGRALSQVQIGDVPIGKYAGNAAFILWRSVYLVKQVATRNRVLVTFDWLKSAIFGRDITRL